MKIGLLLLVVPCVKMVSVKVLPRPVWWPRPTTKVENESVHFLKVSQCRSWFARPTRSSEWKVVTTMGAPHQGVLVNSTILNGYINWFFDTSIDTAWYWIELKIFTTRPLQGRISDSMWKPCLETHRGLRDPPATCCANHWTCFPPKSNCFMLLHVAIPLVGSDPLDIYISLELSQMLTFTWQTATKCYASNSKAK